MGNLWICKDKQRLYQQCSFAAPEETEDGIARVKLKRRIPLDHDIPGDDPWKGDAEGFWVNRDTLKPVTFEMIERAFIQCEITY